MIHNVPFVLLFVVLANAASSSSNASSYADSPLPSMPLASLSSVPGGQSDDEEGDVDLNCSRIDGDAEQKSSLYPRGAPFESQHSAARLPVLGESFSPPPSPEDMSGRLLNSGSAVVASSQNAFQPISTSR